MADIKSVPHNIQFTTNVQAQQTQEAEAVRKSSKVEVQDVSESVVATPSTQVEGTVVTPPTTKSESFTSEQVSGATSFGNTLGGLGAIPYANEGLLLAFLKLQLLDGNLDNTSQNLLNLGKLTLRGLAHNDEGVLGLIATNQIRAGTEGLNVALRAADALKQMRNELVALLAGIRPDVKGRAEAFAEVDKIRNEVARLVLDVAQKHELAQAGQLRQF